MSFNFNQPQLPFPIDRALANPIQITHGQPHFQINIPVHPGLQQYLPFIATAAIELIQSRYTQNALRMFMYNQMSSNYYQNNDYLGFVKSICQFVELMMAKGAYRDIQSAIVDGTEKVGEMCCAENLRTFPQLCNMIDPVLFQRSQASLQLVQQWAQEVAQYHQMGNQIQQPFQNNLIAVANNNPNGWNNNSQQNGFYNNNTTSGIFNNSSNVIQNSNVSSVRDNFLVNANAATTVEPVQVTNNGWQTDIQKMPEPVQSISAASLGIEGISPGCTVVKASDGVKFVPTVKYPYTIAYDAMSYELYYAIETDGSMRPILKPYTTKELEALQLDKAKHFHSNNLTNPTTHHSIENGYKERVADFTDSLKGIKILPGTPEITTDASSDDVLEEGLQMDLSIDVFRTCISDIEMWKDSDLELHSRKSKSMKTNAHLELGYVANTFVSVNDPKPLANELLACKSFVMAANVLADAKAVISQQHKSKNSQHVFSYIHNRLTERLNKFVKNELCLDIQIDSFIEDSVALIEAIHSKYGDNFSDPLRIAQSKIIEDAVTYLSGEINDSYLEFYVQNELDVEVKPSVTFFCNSPDLFISVALFSSDLKIKLPDNSVSNALFKEQNPILHQLAEYAFKVEEDTGKIFNRRMIKTLDDVVIHLYRSKLDPEVYLINTK